MLATTIKDVEERKLKIGEFYSGMTPYASWQTNYTYTENNSLGSSATVGINVGASAGVQNGQNMSVTDSTADTENSSVTETELRSDSLSSSEATAKSNSKSHTDEPIAVKQKIKVLLIRKEQIKLNAESIICLYSVGYLPGGFWNSSCAIIKVIIIVLR